MPLYDCMLLLKPRVKQEALLDLAARVAKHVYSRNGVITNFKSFGKVQLGYGIKKLDGRYYEGKMMQLTVMATPNLNKELHYLNKEDRLLRWLLVKHRETNYGLNVFTQDDEPDEFNDFPRESIFGDVDGDVDDDEDKDDSDDDEEYENQEVEKVESNWVN